MEGQFVFGNNVKESVFGGLVTDQGYIIGTNFALADIDIRERGINAFAKVGRVHDLWNEENISGIKWTIGVGYFQHKIRLAEGLNAVPFFEDPYVRGFDRLTNGVGITQFLGYQYLDARGRLNFFIGLEATEAFTQDRRKLNYNTRSVPKESRFDMMIGAKVGFQITIRRFQNPEEIWY